MKRGVARGCAAAAAFSAVPTAASQPGATSRAPHDSAWPTPAASHASTRRRGRRGPATPHSGVNRGSLAASKGASSAATPGRFQPSGAGPSHTPVATRRVAGRAYDTGATPLWPSGWLPSDAMGAQHARTTTLEGLGSCGKF